MDVETFIDERILGPLAEKPLREWGSQEYTVAILSGMAAGALLISVLAAPNLAQVFDLFKTKNRKTRYRISEKMRYLERSGYIARTKNQYMVTKKGTAYLDEYHVWSIRPHVPKRWDGKWHLVAFDIPGKKQFERPRQALRARLKELGFVRYQDSLFVHQYDMRDAIEKFATFYEIHEYLSFITATKIDNERAVAKQCLLPS